ncbi:MAG: hypothetical protein KAT25_09935 [Sulfuriflexus sp.]|nr:hypothetical protein [Sulfuriflexus sp.]
MDTTIALFFSLGIVMSPTNEPAPSVQADTAKQVIVQQAAKPTSKAIKRHELVKNRIAATNAWLASQRKERRDLAKKHQLTQLSSNTQSCGADWNLT